MKVVVKLKLDGDKQKQKAIEAVSTLHGIDSIAVDMKVQRMTVVGAVDPADVLKKLCNSFPTTDIVSVEPAKEKRKDAVEIQTFHGSPHHPPLPGGSGDHPHLVTAELSSPGETVVLPERSTEAPVCALVDAMYRLPAKLDGLLRHGRMLPKGAEHEIPLIKQDLEVMIAVFHYCSNSRAENCDMVIECLMKEVRELSYDIEDCIDQYEHAVDSRSGSVSRIPPRQITRRKSRTSRLPKKLKQRLRMANEIREFSVRSQEALQRYNLFNPDGISTSSTRCDASFGPWYPTSYGERADHLVGIDAPMNKLEAWMTRDGEQKLKFVSIVGSGGVGKTTLANELYCRIGGQFECQAFVRTSQRPDIRRLLISMLSQVRPNKPPVDWKVHSLIADIRTHLQDKRYLIVVDDVWATSTWDIVNCALPDGNRCSRILITSEVEDVALKCCGYDPKYVYKMKPLGEDDSRKLFFNTVVVPPEFSEVPNNIIRKCGGLPLAIVTTASLLASRMGKPEQWEYVDKSLGYGLMTNPILEAMKQVLNLSYSNLPQHLKACMLYLSIYPGDYIIWKDDLVKQWIAEGFICATEGKDEEEISRNYFDELISSRMIQPVHINDTDEILSCTVHYMVLNFIKHKSIVENFVTAIDHSQTSTRLTDKVRRLSLHFGNAEDATPPTNMRLSQIRTLAFFGVFNCVPSIMEFRILQVLILQFWGDEDSISLDLTRISELFRLRYLQVTSNVTLELRAQMQGLQYLETLKIDARTSIIPSDIIHLPHLLHLTLPAETNLPSGIGHMTSLRTLGYFDLSRNSIENVQSLGELTNLRDLQLTCYTVQPDNLKNNMQCVGSILWKLSNLKSLTLVSVGSSCVNCLDVAGGARMSISGDGLSSVPSPPALLQRLELLPCVCIFSKLPKWIGHLCKLCILKIGVSELARNDVDILRGLPALTVLSLYVRTKLAERIVFDKAGFSVLRYFNFRCTVVPWLKFEVDAMPNLQKLKVGFNALTVDQQGTTPISIEHLSGLKEISAKIGGAGADTGSALMTFISNHPRNPRINVQLMDYILYYDQSMGTKEKEHRTLEEKDAIMEEDQDQCYRTQDEYSGEDENKQADSSRLESFQRHVESTLEGFQRQIENKLEGFQRQTESKLEGFQGQIEGKLEGFQGQIERKLEGFQGQIEGLRQEVKQLARLHSNRQGDQHTRSPETPSTEPATRKLAFQTPPMLPILTGCKIVDANGKPLQVILVEADTGSRLSLPQFLRIELVPLSGDFPLDDSGEWSADEFQRGIVEACPRKRPLLIGDVNLTMRDGCVAVNELQFTNYSSRFRCPEFRIGVRVVPGSYDGARIGEAMTEAFDVRHHRSELYRKHYPPALCDDVWRLEKIAKDGIFHRKLAQHHVRTVQEFLRMLEVKPDVLRAILGASMRDRMWEAATTHAKQCDAGDKVYMYSGGRGGTIYVNSICQFVKIELGGVEYYTLQQLDTAQTMYAQQLCVEAYEQWNSLQEADAVEAKDAAGKGAGTSSGRTLDADVRWLLGESNPMLYFPRPSDLDQYKK